jgi:hypothetical protein
MIIFIALYVVIGYYATQIKAYELPINKNLSPEQIIESEFADIKQYNQDYNYFIKDDFLFVSIKHSTGFCNYDIAFKNKNSGFMFNVPGTIVGSIYQRININTMLKDNKAVESTIKKYGEKYVIVISDLFNRDIDIYIDDVKIDPFTFDDCTNTCWADVFLDLSDECEIYGVFEGDKYHIANNTEIKSYFGGIE